MNKNLSLVSEEELLQHRQSIGLLVKKLRQNKGISQLDMALSVGIRSVAFYSNCENSRRNKHFNVDHLFKICKALEIPLSEFFLQIELNQGGLV